ncbi:TPA: SDR family oxidoreductase [Streptococcus suis]
MTFEDKVVVITGGASGIGLACAQAFRAEGAKVQVIDKVPGDHYVGDIGQEGVLEAFAARVIAQYGRVDFLINNAAPPMIGIDQASYQDFQTALAIGVTAPFYLTQLFKDYFAPGAVIINLSSTRQSMSQAQTETYSAAKGGIGALTHALAMSLAGKVRVNAISPGWIDASGASIQGPDACQHPVGRVGQPADVVNLILFLCSDQASFITGQNFTVDGGMTKQMIYHQDQGWAFELE